MSVEIVCTLGPASQESQVIEQLIQHGMTIARINLSHGDHDTHQQTIQHVRQTAKTLGKEVRILGDLQGPKIRLGIVEGNGVNLQKGQPFSLFTTPRTGNNQGASVDYPGLTNDIKPGAPILINDGEIKLVTTSIQSDTIKTEVLVGGTISSHKGVNLPGTKLSMPSMTTKDKQDLAFLLKMGVDFIACSFIRQAANLTEIQQYAKSLAATKLPRFIAKLETVEGLRNFSEILKAADGIMIARGDMGVELPYTWIPVLQKAIIRECQKQNTFVITATQMLQSMIEHPIPTRAEVTDVFQAVLDGTSAVMLSAESAAGKFPVESVEALKTISRFAEFSSHQAPFDLTDLLSLLASQQLQHV